MITARDGRKTQRTENEINQMGGSGRIRYELVELSNQSSIYALANRWRGPLYVLINTAGTTSRKRLETPVGHR